MVLRRRTTLDLRLRVRELALRRLATLRERHLGQARSIVLTVAA